MCVAAFAEMGSAGGRPWGRGHGRALLLCSGQECRCLFRPMWSCQEGSFSLKILPSGEGDDEAGGNGYTHTPVPGIGGTEQAPGLRPGLSGVADPGTEAEEKCMGARQRREMVFCVREARMLLEGLL